MKKNKNMFVAFDDMTDRRTLNTLKDFANSAKDGARFTSQRDRYNMTICEPLFHTSMKRMSLLELQDGSYEVGYYWQNGLTVMAKLERLHNSEQFDAITLTAIYLPALF